MEAQVAQEVRLPAAEPAPPQAEGEGGSERGGVLRPAEEPRQRAAEVAAAGDGREVVEAPEEVRARQPLQHAERERGRPDAAARERQPGQAMAKRVGRVARVAGSARVAGLVRVAGSARVARVAAGTVARGGPVPGPHAERPPPCPDGFELGPAHLGRDVERIRGGFVLWHRRPPARANRNTPCGPRQAGQAPTRRARPARAAHAGRSDAVSGGGGDADSRPGRGLRRGPP